MVDKYWIKMTRIKRYRSDFQLTKCNDCKCVKSFKNQCCCFDIRSSSNISQDIFGILQPFYNIPVSKFYDRTLPVKDNFNGPDLS